MNPEQLGKQIAKFLLIENFTEKISLYPGAFKPPHKGHVSAVLDSIDSDTDKLILFVSTKPREDVEVEESLKVWELYKNNIPGLKKLEIIPTPTPVTAVYNYAKDNPTHNIKAIFGKGEEERFVSLANKEKYPNVEIYNAGTVGNFSATDLRQALRDNNIEKIKEFIPEEVNVDDFLAIFQTNEGLYPRYNAKKVQQTRYKASDVWTNDPDVLEEDDPKKGTGKKPKGSSRRLYTDEDPSDTVGIKFSSRQDIVDTLNKTSFKNKSHARQSQIINLIHQRVRAAYNRAKDPLVKARLKIALEYAEERKEASKNKTQRLKNQKLNEQKQDIKFKRPKLNYSYNSLQPYIDKETMEEHFDKHFKGYTDKLNTELDEKSIRIDAEDQIRAIQIILGKYPKNSIIKNNGGGFYNHILYFENMTPDYKEPSTKFKKILEENFNSFSEFKEQFKEAGLKQFGSGWVFLIKKGDKLVIESYANQDNPYLDKDFKGKILIAMDVWEHSYYLKHKSQRGNYIDDFFKVIDYKVAEERLEEEFLTENIDPKAQSKHKGKSAPFGSAYEPVKEGDTIEKYSAKGKATGKLKQGTVRKRLNISKDKKIPLSLINKELSRLKKMDKDDNKKGVQLGDKNQKYYKALQLAKTLKTTTNQNESTSLQEIGDLSQQPYSWKYLPDNSDKSTKVYRFEAKDGIQYEVNLYYVGSYADVDGRFEKGDWTLEFLAKAPGIGGYSSKALTGGGEPLKVMSTVVDITKDFIKDNGNVGRIVYTPTEGKTGERDAKDNIRGKLYKAIIQRSFPKAKISGSDNTAIIIDVSAYSTEELDETIVGNKIVCDNCGWEWKIEDGGEDLYICHKCDHDNTPITEETLFEEEDKLMSEVVNPDGDRFEYEQVGKGLYTYKDSKDNLYFARITYSPSSSPRFEFKVGWFEDNNISMPIYNPGLPSNITAMDNLKRRNTVAKIYRDEILPFFKQNQKLAKQLDINPISQSRYIFSQRLVQKHTPSEYNVDLKDGKIIISIVKNKNKYLQEARYKKYLSESWEPNKARVINQFLDYCTDYLSIDRPTIKLINSPEYTQQYHSFGGYVPSSKKLIVVVHNRNMADILRTIAHEMVHHMQNLDNRLNPKSGEDGSPDENEANSLAGVIMREFGRNNPHIYE